MGCTHEWPVVLLAKTAHSGYCSRCGHDDTPAHGQYRESRSEQSVGYNPDRQEEHQCNGKPYLVCALPGLKPGIPISRTPILAIASALLYCFACLTKSWLRKRFLIASGGCDGIEPGFGFVGSCLRSTLPWLQQNPLLSSFHTKASQCEHLVH